MLFRISPAENKIKKQASVIFHKLKSMINCMQLKNYIRNKSKEKKTEIINRKTIEKEKLNVIIENVKRQ